MEEGSNSRRSGARSALKAMVSFFTIWHQDIDQNDMDEMEQRFHLAPVVGMLFGAIVLIATTLLLVISNEVYFGGSTLAAAVVLATVYIGSKFLHFDGLTDFGDGMVVSGDQEKHVRALKDTLVGAGGVGVALVVVLLSFAAYACTGSTLLLMVAPVTEIMVKNAMVVAAAYGKAGNGMAGRQVALTTTGSIAKSSSISIVLSLVLLFFGSWFVAELTYNTFQFGDLFLGGAIMVLVAVVVSYVVGYMMASVANRNFGMVNGDILGATNEIARPFVVFFAALVLYALLL